MNSKQSASLIFDLMVSFCLDAFTHRYQINEIFSPLPLIGKEQQKIIVSPLVSFNLSTDNRNFYFLKDDNSFPQLPHIFIIT